MIIISFSWDEKKNEADKKKHGVSFDEARTVFYDENAIRYFDPDHSGDEDGFLMGGMSQKLRILIVCHCFREEGPVIGIISARKATKGEEDVYWSEKSNTYPPIGRSVLFNDNDLI
ncbi:MAG: BrnT family toxin [Deltaproteobacteria bacterium]|nr:BrnT family toxin [Deltaproteobacteria bacterium]